MHMPGTLHAVQCTASALQPLMQDLINRHACMQAHTSMMAPRIPVSLLVLLHAASMLLTFMPANGDGSGLEAPPAARAIDGSPLPPEVRRRLPGYNATRASECGVKDPGFTDPGFSPPGGLVTAPAQLEGADLCDCIEEGYIDMAADIYDSVCPPAGDPAPEEDAAPPPPAPSTPPPAPSTPPAAPAPPQLAVPVNSAADYGATTAGTVNAVAGGACAGGPAAIDREAVFDPCCLVAPNAALATTPFTNVANGTVCLPQVTYDLADVEGSGECCAWAYAAGANPPQMSPTVREDLAVNEAVLTSGAIKIDRAACRGLYEPPQANEESGGRKLSVHGVAAVLVAACAVLATAAVV